MSFFKTIDELAEIMPIFKTAKLSDLSTDIFATEEEFLVPILGREFYEQLDELYNDGEPTEVESELIKLVQRVVGSMAAPLLIPKLNVQVKNTGVSQNHGENSKPAFQWSIEDLKRTHWAVGYKCIEALYDFLERKQESFTEWVDGEGFSEAYSLLVWSASIFQKYVDIKKSRRVYMALKPHLLDAQLEVKNTTGAELLEAVLEDIPDLGTQELADLIPYLQRAICHRGMASALGSLALTIDGNGVSVYDNSATSLELNNLKNASDVRISAKKDFHNKVADEAIEGLRKFLVANKENYPLYTASSAYQENYSPNSINDTDRAVFNL